jgi:HSP20 family molecular chaperone IbpA
MIWHDMKDTRAEMESRFHAIVSGNMLLPAGGVSDRMLPAIRGGFRGDAREDDDDIMIVVNLPGVEKTSVALQIINPRSLEVAFTRDQDQDTEKKPKAIISANACPVP